MPDEYQTEALFQAHDILVTSDDERHKIAAIKLLVEMTKVDQRDDLEKEPESETYDDIPNSEPDVERRACDAEGGV